MKTQMSDEEERAWNALRNDFTSSKLSRLHSNKKKEREKLLEDHPHTHTNESIHSFSFLEETRLVFLFRNCAIQYNKQKQQTKAKLWEEKEKSGMERLKD